MIDFLFSHQIPGRATGLDVFKMLCDLYSQSKLSWNRCVTICTDRAAAMTGKHSGVVARVRQLVPNIIQAHCEALTAKHLGQSMSEVFDFMSQSCKFNQNLPTSVSIVFHNFAMN